MPSLALLRGAAGVLLTTLISARSATAQTIAVRDGALPCQAAAAQRPDTGAFTLYLAPPLSTSGAPSDAQTYAPFVHAVAEAFQPPDGIAMESWPGTIYEGDAPTEDDAIHGVGPLTGQVQFRLAKGRVRDLAWELLPDSRDVSRAVQQAIHRADSLQHFLGLKAPRGGLVRLSVTMTSQEAPAGSAPLVRVRLPYLRADSPVAVMEIPRPRYPAAAERRPVEGDVTLQYVVDEHGRAQQTSFRVISANYQEFVDAATDAIAAGSFRPAQSRGCPVKLTVQQRIRFQVR
jgi:TonB family protein